MPIGAAIMAKVKPRSLMMTLLQMIVSTAYSDDILQTCPDTYAGTAGVTSELPGASFDEEATESA